MTSPEDPAEDYQRLADVQAESRRRHEARDAIMDAARDKLAAALGHPACDHSPVPGGE